MKNVTFYLIVLLACSFLISCSTTEIRINSTPSLTPRINTSDELIVFYSERDGDAEIYVMNPDGSNQMALTDNSFDDFSPIWSPNGSQIVFESDRDDQHPRTCFPNCNYNLYIMNADGSDQRQLTSLPGAEWHASWSPDGTQIVYTAGDVGFLNGAFYILDVKSGESRILLDDQFNNDGADWSPDGSRIAFISDRDETMDIYAMNTDGSGIEKLIDTGLEDYSPDWSPDGTQIVFFAFDLPSIRQDIYVVNSDGSNLQNLNSTPQVVDESASWSPDGSQILFHTDRDGNFEVYIMNADGSQQTNLTNDRGRDYCPDW